MSPSTRSRRSVLGLGGTALAALAGCLGPASPADDQTNAPDDQTPSDATETTDGSADETTTAPARYDVSVADVSVTPALVALDSPDSIGTFGDRDEQFVVVTVDPAGSDGPAPDEFAVVVGETAVRPTTVADVATYGGFYPRRGTPYEAGSRGYLVFSLPKPIDPAEAALRWPGGRYAFDDHAVSRLSRPPTDFAVADLSAPASVESGTTVTVETTIENTGSVAGEFVGAVNRSGPRIAYTPVERLSVELDAGASETWTSEFTPTLEDVEETRPMRVSLDWRGGSTSVEVTVEPSG